MDPTFVAFCRRVVDAAFQCACDVQGTYPIDRSILMDFTPSSQRGMWNAVTPGSMGDAGWGPGATSVRPLWGSMLSWMNLLLTSCAAANHIDMDR